MKKIKDWKKFESAQEEDEFDYDYVKQCFIELIESGKVEYIDDDFVQIEYRAFATPDILGIGNPFDEPKQSDLKPNVVLGKIESYIKGLDETKEVMLDIQAGIERLLEEHPNYICDLFFNDGHEYGELVDTPTIKLSIWNTHH
jgi:hypothetical protein